MGYADESGKIISFIQEGCSSMDSYHDLRGACDYFKKASDCAMKIYGKGSKICSMVNLFDYIWEEYCAKYQDAALKLADVGELLDQFGEQDAVDEFTSWIWENRDELMNRTVAATLDIIIHLDFQFSLENLLMQALLCKNDLEEVINRTLIDPLGLPRKFHFLISRLSIKTDKITPDMLYEVGQLLAGLKNVENQLSEGPLDEEKKAELARLLFGLVSKGENIFSKDSMDGGMQRFMGSSIENMYFDFARGMMLLKDDSYADWFLDRIKDEEIGDIDARIKIMILECWLKYEQGYKAEAENILDDIIELENGVITQVFFLKDEQRKIGFLNGLTYLTKRIADICCKIRGARAAYSVVVRTRTLSFDRAVIRLDSDMHKKILSKMLKLEELEKEGKNVALEKNRLIEHLEKASGGIFTLDSIEICRKLTDRQAILEFTQMTDGRDDDYYYVFVVTAGNIRAVQLGKCAEIDPLLDAILQFIMDYMVNKYSSKQIRMLPAYYDIFQRVLLPVGETLPHGVHTLYIAASGKFLQIPFGMLPGFYWYDEFMEETYHIFYINSGKELLREPTAAKKSGAAVIGSPDFEGKYPDLPSSLREVNAIADILKVRPITGKDAVPGCLKEAAGILHIATHFFNAPETGTRDTMDPMDQGYLVFAGGSLLTLREISLLDLSGTDLVVLSVCGMQEKEGVYSDVGPGIRRAFINAGVRFLILNLWKTDDNAAELMMRSFYDYYINEKMGLEEAFRKAKHFVRSITAGGIRKLPYYDRDTYPVAALMDESEVPYAHPYYWAGFIIVGI